jgi:hypothetical protein
LPARRLKRDTAAPSPPHPREDVTCNQRPLPGSRPDGTARDAMAPDGPTVLRLPDGSARPSGRESDGRRSRRQSRRFIAGPPRS